MPNKEEIKKAIKPIELPKEEKDKHRALLVGVIFFMSLIFFLWTINFESILKFSANKEKKPFDIDKFSEEFRQSIDEVGVKMEKFKQISPELLISAPTTTAAVKK